jgi:hypothetical protein
MRTLKLSHQEIELIENALLYVYDKKLDMVSNSKRILDKEQRDSIMSVANKYFDLQEQISNSEKDV